MKHSPVLIFILFILIGTLYGELDFQHTDNLFDGYTASILGNNVVKDGNRVLLIDSYGVSLYETTQDNLTDLATYNFPMVSKAALLGDKMALSLANTEEDPINGDLVNLYDISNIENPQLIHQIYTNVSQVYLKENVIILGFYNQIQIYSVDTLELLNTYPSISLAYNIEDSEYFTIESQNEENFYLCHLSSEEQLVRDKNLGASFGRPIMQDNKLLYCHEQVIDFYSIADSLTFESAFIIEDLAELELPGLFVFDNILVVPSGTMDIPHIQQLSYYDISNLDNIIELEDYEFFPELGAYKSFRIVDTIQWADNFLLVMQNFGVIYSNYNDHLDDYTILKYSRPPSISKRIDNSLYVNYGNAVNCNIIFDLTDLNDITQVEHEDSLGYLYWFTDNEYQFVAHKNYSEGTFQLYSFSDNNFNYLATYELSDFLKNWQNNISINLWNGQDLIYSFGQNIYWLKYENGSFLDVYIDEVAQPNLTHQWFYYNNYFYKATYSGLIKVYAKQENELVLENNLIWAYGNTSFANRWGIKDGLLTIANISTNRPSKIYDLDIDPVNLTAQINLNAFLMNSLVQRCGDFYFYTGCDNENNTNCFYEQLSYLNIYKKVGNDFVRVGDIYNHRQTWDLEIIPQDEDNFTVLLCSTRGIDVYSCQATPNGDLDVIPLTLNASNYPNPFNPETTISYDISQAGIVTVDIYNLRGQKVKSLLNETQDAGQHKIIWQGDNEDGKKVSSGTYFYKIKNGEKELIKKMTLMK